MPAGVKCYSEAEVARQRPKQKVLGANKDQEAWGNPGSSKMKKWGD